MAGEINKVYAFLIKTEKSKTNQALTVGQLVKFDTNGMTPTGAAADGPFGVCLDAVTAEVGVQKDVRVMRRGVVTVAANGAINSLTAVVADDSGEVKAITAETAIKVVGQAMETIAGDGDLEILLSGV